MRDSKIDHSLGARFTKIEVSSAAKAHIASAFNRCAEATTDLERFLAHAAADAKDRDLHRALYDGAKTIGDLPIALRAALESVDAFVDVGGTATGAIERAALEARVAMSGRNDATLREGVEHAFLRALGVYDDALEEIVKAPPGFAELLLEQRKIVSHLHRALAARPPCSER